MDVLNAGTIVVVLHAYSFLLAEQMRFYTRLESTQLESTQLDSTQLESTQQESTQLESTQLS